MKKRKQRLDQIQHPLAPEESAKHNRLPPGFEASVFVSEPNIVNPIDITWDDRGRLYVAESLDYPHDLQEYGKGQDCITLCEDTDGDGKADKFTTFAEGLSIPTSILYYNGGIIVAHAPTVLFLKDTDGDDKADQVIELNRGWGTHDTHAGPSNLNYGLDNKIYGSVGYAGGPEDENSDRFRNALFRVNPDGSNIEALTNFTNNTWGLGISEDFEIFGSTANHDAAFHMPIAYPDYDKSLVEKRGAKTIYDTARVFPLVPMRQVDAHGKYTAGSGFNIYTARNFPEKYWNSAAFIGEPTGHLLGQFFLEKSGASYRAINGENMLVSTDEYTSPVQARIGPDGNLWMVDWSNLIIQHNPIPDLNNGGFESHNAGRGAHWNPLRDKKHGRIYRISHKRQSAKPIPNIENASSETLVQTLKNDNMLWRNKAQIKLINETRLDATDSLIKLAQDQSSDANGMNPAAIHALWTLKGLGQLNGEYKPANAVAYAALKHPAPGVRKNAVRVLPSSDESAEVIAKSNILRDPDLTVRRNALIASANQPPSQSIAHILAESYETNLGDLDLEDAQLIALAKHNQGVLQLTLSQLQGSHPGEITQELLDYQSRIALTIFQNDPNQISDAIEQLTQIEPTLAGYIFRSLVQLKDTQLNSKQLDVIRVSAEKLNIVNKQYLATFAANNQLPLDLGASAEVTPFEAEMIVGHAHLAKNKFIPLCVGCHGSDLAGNEALQSPSLAGQWDWYIQTQLQKYRAGLRGNDPTDANAYSMRNFVKDLTTKEIADISAYIKYDTQLKKQSLTIEGNAERGKALYQSCIPCHGTAGEGNQTLKSPKLVGLQDWYILRSLKDFKSGKRGNDPADSEGQLMQSSATLIESEQDMRDLAVYINTLHK